MFSDLDGYKIITYDNRKMKTTATNRAEEFASWYLTSNVDLSFLAKKGKIKSVDMEIKYFILKDGKTIFHHKIPFFNWNKHPYYLQIPDIEFDAFVINAIFLYDVNYFHIGLNCEDIKFAYRYFKEMEAGSKYELGSFIPYERGYRFFSNRHFMK